MKFEKLGNIVEILSGFAFKSSLFNDKGNGLPLIRVRDVNSGFAGMYFSGEYDDLFLVKKGDLLIGLDGDFKCVEWDFGEALLNQRVCKVIPKPDKVDRNYIFHFLPAALNEIHRNTNYTTVKHLSVKTINEISIPFPSLETQLHIANILSKAESLISQRKESIRLLDEYLKSVFLEMFGDPISNIKNWQILTMKEIGESRLGKMLDKKKIVGNNLKPYLRNSNVLWFDFKLDDLLEMDFDDKDKIEFSLKHGDVLMCEGGEIGRCAIWKNALKECYFQKAIHRIRLNNQIALPEFFVYMFWQYTLNGGLNKYVGTATISHLTGEKLKQLKLPVPPLELQTQFAQIVEKIEALKAQYQQSLQELENLYGSLSQKAFKGELTIKDESLLMAAEPETKYYTLTPDLKEKD